MLPPASDTATAGSPLFGSVKARLPRDRSCASVPTFVPVGEVAGVGDPAGLVVELVGDGAGSLAPTWRARGRSASTQTAATAPLPSWINSLRRARSVPGEVFTRAVWGAKICRAVST